MKRKTRIKNYLKNNPPVNLRKDINAAYKRTDAADKDAQRQIDRMYTNAIDALIGKITGFQERYKITSYADAKKYGRLQSLFEALDERINGLSLEQRKLLGLQRIKTFKTAYADTSEAYSGALGVSFGGPNKKALEAFKEMPVLGADIKSLTDQQRRNLANRVRREVTQGLVLGESPLTIARRIAKAGKIARHHAVALARTNVIAAHGQAVLNFKEDNKDVFTGVRWFTQLDERTCPICAPRHLRSYYKQVPDHPAHFNCRCALNPIAEPAIQKVLDGQTSRIKPEVAA